MPTPARLPDANDLRCALGPRGSAREGASISELRSCGAVSFRVEDGIRGGFFKVFDKGSFGGLGPLTQEAASPGVDNHKA